MKYDSCLGLKESGGLSSQGLLCSSWRCGWPSSNSHCVHTRRAVCPVPKVLMCALYVQSLNTQCGFLTEKNTIILASPVSPLWFLFFSIEGEGRNEAVRCKAIVSLSGRRWHEQKLEWIFSVIWWQYLSQLLQTAKWISSQDVDQDHLESMTVSKGISAVCKAEYL